MAAVPRRLILCADDFALSPAISRVIAGLARARKINAITCMAICPGWAADSRLLAGLPPAVEIGLHLVLTGEPPLTAMPGLAPAGRLPTINRLHRLAARQQLDLAEIEAEIRAQFDRFEAFHSAPPAFVDGHQHAHLLRGIRDLVLAETARRAPGAWLRNCADRVGAMLARPFAGKALASALHARGFGAAAARHGLACNDGFGGHYDFRSDWTPLFARFLARPGRVHLVMCHPGADDLAGDAIAASRRREARALEFLPVRAIAAEHGLAMAG